MAQFPDTQWSLIRRSGDSPSARHVAFGELVRRYRSAIRAYFGARLSAEDADDATQSFLSASYEHAWWARADAEAGSFRSFLLMLLRRHLGHLREVRRLDQVDLEAAGELADVAPDSQRQFDTRFVLVLTARAVDALRLQYRERGREALFEQLVQLLSAPPEHGELKQIAESLQLPANTLTVELKRLRTRLRDQLAEELRGLCADPQAFAEDWSALRDLLER